MTKGYEMVTARVLHAQEAPVHRTPNAVMTTLAAPSVGSDEVALWRVHMEPGAAGPEHTVDREQVLTVLAGAVRVVADGTAVQGAVGDALILPAGVSRRVVAVGTEAVEAIVASTVGARASTSADGDRGVLPWAS